jgi:hypothetical protein
MTVIVKSTAFCVVGLPAPPGLSLGLLFGRKDKAGMFLRNVLTSPNCEALQLKQGVLEITNRLLSLIRRGPHRKQRGQQFFHRCVCIRYRGNVSTEPLLSNDRGIFTEPLPSDDRGGYTETHTDSNVIS